MLPHTFDANIFGQTAFHMLPVWVHGELCEAATRAQEMTQIASLETQGWKEWGMEGAPEGEAAWFCLCCTELFALYRNVTALFLVLTRVVRRSRFDPWLSGPCPMKGAGTKPTQQVTLTEAEKKLCSLEEVLDTFRCRPRCRR